MRLHQRLFPKNHNLILLGQPSLNTTLQLRPNSDFKSRVTYSARLDTLAPDTLESYIHAQLDHANAPAWLVPLLSAYRGLPRTRLGMEC